MTKKNLCLMFISICAICVAEPKVIRLAMNQDSKWCNVDLFLSANIEWMPQNNDTLDLESQDALQNAVRVYKLLLDKENSPEKKRYYNKLIENSAKTNNDAKYAKSLFDFYNMLSSKTEYKIICQVTMDKRKLFIVRLSPIGSEKGSQNNTIVHLILERKYKEWIIAEPSNVELLVYNALKKTNENIINNQLKLTESNCQHINLLSCKNRQDNISIHFSGVSVSSGNHVDNYQNKRLEINDMDITSFFVKIKESFEQMPILDFINRYYTEESAQNYIKVISTFNADALVQFRSNVLKNTNTIHYIVKIPPLYIIFNTNTSNQIISYKHHTRHFQYLYLFEDNNTYKITNDTMKENIFDKLIKANIIDMDSIIINTGKYIMIK